ncbi:MAG TPA: acyltransferase [Galbitalea sp.]|nr:acyltransferase [Galbitalea sp.]
MSAPVAAPPRQRLWEIDVVRILTFLCVIGVHTISHTSAPDNISLFMLLGLVHFTRDVFFALTAFVLVFTYFKKPVPMRQFWPRRFLLVGVPYLAWSVIYFFSKLAYTGTSASPGAIAGQFLLDIVTGKAWYHLYFLLVTMQVYLLLPVVVGLIRRTRGHHALVLAVVGALQLVIVGCYFYFPQMVSGLTHYKDEYFFSYIFFIVAGAAAADHREALFGWVRRHRPLIAVLTVVTGVITVGVFLLQIAAGHSFTSAVTPLQPIVMVWAVAICFAFLAIGSVWAEPRRPDGFGTRFVNVASDRSFGIFLSHPLFIWLLLWIGNDWFEKTVAKPWLTLVIYLLVIVGAIALTELARRTPLSLPLTGRRFSGRWFRTTPRPPQPAPELDRSSLAA